MPDHKKIKITDGADWDWMRTSQVKATLIDSDEFNDTYQYVVTVDEKSDLAIQIDRIEEKIDQMMAIQRRDDESRKRMQRLFNGPDPP